MTDAHAPDGAAPPPPPPAPLRFDQIAEDLEPFLADMRPSRNLPGVFTASLSTGGPTGSASPPSLAAPGAGTARAGRARVELRAVGARQRGRLAAHNAACLARCVDRKGKGGRVAAAEQALNKAHFELLDATYQACLAALDVEDSVRQQAASLEAAAPALAAVRQSIGAAQAALDA